MEKIFLDLFTSDDLICLRDILLDRMTFYTSQISILRKQLLSCVDISEANTLSSTISLYEYKHYCCSTLFDLLGSWWLVK